MVREVNLRNSVASENLEELIKLQDKETSQKLKKEAMNLYKAGENQRAIEIFEQSIQKDYSNLDLYINLSLVYLKLQDFQPVFKLFRRARQIDPLNFKILEREGKLHQQVGNPINAALSTKKALEAQPNNEWMRDQILRKDIMNIIKGNKFLEEVWITL